MAEVVMNTISYVVSQSFETLPLVIQGDPKKIGISVFFIVFCNFFWVTVNYTIKIENCLYLADFLKSIEHNRKIRNSKNVLEKKFVKQKICNSYIYMHSRFFMDFWWRNFEIWPENPRTNFAHFLLFKDFYLTDLLVN